jgi:hypothetical protein
MGTGVQIIVYMGMQYPAADRIDRVVSKSLVAPKPALSAVKRFFAVDRILAIIVLQFLMFR